MQLRALDLPDDIIAEIDRWAPEPALFGLRKRDARIAFEQHASDEVATKNTAPTPQTTKSTIVPKAERAPVEVMQLSPTSKIGTIGSNGGLS